MGDYRIVLEGHGPHDNGRADDADNQAVRFRDLLRTLGHDVTYVSFGLRNGTGAPLEPVRDLTDAQLAHADGPERYSDSVDGEKAVRIPALQPE